MTMTAPSVTAPSAQESAQESARASKISSQRPALNDFYELDALYTPQEKYFRDKTRDFITSEILPRIGTCWLNNEFPRDFPKQCGELGLLGATLPKAVGGSDASFTTYGLINQEVEYGDSGLRSFTSVQTSLIIAPIYHYATETIKKTWLTPMINGDAIGAFSLSEPQGGSDPSNMHVTVTKKGNRWVVSGRKRWATSAPISDIIIVWAKDSESGKIVGTVVPNDTPGVEVVPITNKASMRTSATSEIFFHDVEVPLENRLQCEGLRVPLTYLNQARCAIAFGVVGAGWACFNEARDYVAHRDTFGEPIAAKQLVQADLADMLADLTKASLVAYHLGRLKADNLDTPARVSLAKRDNVRATLGVARKARDLLGGNGILTDYAAIRHMNNLESVSTYEGTDHVHTLIMGQAITGIKSF